MILQKIRLTDDQVFQIYFLWKRDNLTSAQIGERLGVNAGSVASSKKYIKEYWHSNNSSKKLLRNPYKIGVQRIKVAIMNEARLNKRNAMIQHTHEEPVEMTDSNPMPEVEVRTDGDRFTKLAQSFESFQQSLETFIEAEVSERTQSVVVGLEDAKRQLQETQRLLKEAEEAFDTARNSNWVDAMKKKWQNK